MAALVLTSAGAAQTFADLGTYEVWHFSPSGEVLVMNTIKDLSRDRVDDIVVASRDKSVYALDGATGAKLWNYTADQYYQWVAAVTSPATDVNGNSNSDVLVATNDRLVMMLDGAKGKQLWVFNQTNINYKQGAACSITVRSAHFISDIDNDAVPDSVVLSGTGDNCAQKDRIELLALSSKTGAKLWEYSKAEDYHGIKDGIKGASPVAVLDINKDGALDIVFADEAGSLRVISGKDGTEVRRTELDVFGSIWDLIELPDVSGDGIPDALALEFIEAGGGPDYASIDALDLVGSEVLWQVKVGDGRIDGGALYSAASISGTGAPQVAVTSRTENKLDLVLFDARTGEKVWTYQLGEERSRDDLNKIYPVARIGTVGARDELAVGSIDSKMYLLNPLDASIIWSHSVTGEVGGMAYVNNPNGQKYIIVEDSYLGVRALARQTTIPTELSIETASKTVILSDKVVISGRLQPAFPGELLELRYINPEGAVKSKTLVLEKDGSFTDTIEPEITGEWKVSAVFAGEGIYIGSRSPTVTFTVVTETEPSVFLLKPDETSASYPVSYIMEGSKVRTMSINKDAKTLNIEIDPAPAGGVIRIDLPRSVIEAFQTKYMVYVNGSEATFQEVASDEAKRTLSIPLRQGASQISIAGTYVVPELPPVAAMLIALTMLAAIAVVSRKGWPGHQTGAS